MKKILAIIAISLYFISTSQADDIRDFQIEGISIGDSALDYFSVKDIKKNSKTGYKKKDFTKVENLNYPLSKDYYGINFNFKTGDPEYKIQSISGIIDYRNQSMSKCRKQLEEIYNEISKMFPKWNKNPITTNLHPADPSGKSKDTWGGFFSDTGSITVGCLDYSKETLPNSANHLDISIRTKEFNKFLGSAYE